MRTWYLLTTLAWALACSAVNGTASDVGAGGAAVAGGGDPRLGGAAAAGAGSPNLGNAGSPMGAAGGDAGSGALPSGGVGAADTGGSASNNGGAAATGNGGNGGNGGRAGATGQGGSAGGLARPCPPQTPCVILPLGDSITYGYGSTSGGGYRVPLLNLALTDKKSITFVGSVSSGPDTLNGRAFPKGNEGHSGYSIDDSSQTRGISPLVTQALARYQPNIVLLLIGTNDMHYGLDLANAPARLGALLDQISIGAPNALLVVAQIIPANGAQNTPTQAYNAAIPGLVQARAAHGKHIALVDMYAALNHWSSALYKDSEHPNDAGYSKMADTWYEAIQALLP